MDIIREIVKNINEREYTNIKTMIMNESDRYIRDCSFVREIIFDFMGDKYGMPAVLNRQSNDEDPEEEKLEFRIRMNRYNSGELDLYVKSINGSMVNERKTKLTKTEVPLSTKLFLPAACQGIIAVEAVQGSEAAKICRKMTDLETELCYLIEREVLRQLSADCSEAVAAWCRTAPCVTDRLLLDKYIYTSSSR